MTRGDLVLCDQCASCGCSYPALLVILLVERTDGHGRYGPATCNKICFVFRVVTVLVRPAAAELERAIICSEVLLRRGAASHGKSVKQSDPSVKCPVRTDTWTRSTRRPQCQSDPGLGWRRASDARRLALLFLIFFLNSLISMRKELQ